MNYDPIITWFGAQSIAVLAFLNLPFVRVALIVLGAIVVFWPLRAFQRLRSRLRILGGSIMAEKQWISEEDALEVIRSSEWAKSREPYQTESLGISSFKAFNRVVSGMTQNERDELLFSQFIRATLASFHKDNPKAKDANEDGETKTELSALKTFLDAALMSDAEEKFGKVPSHKVR
jgi:hypothetical protein